MTYAVIKCIKLIVEIFPKKENPLGVPADFLDKTKLSRQKLSKSEYFRNRVKIRKPQILLRSLKKPEVLELQGQKVFSC